MPIYEYECQKCGDLLEAFQKISAPPLKKCGINGCNGKLRRIMSNSSFVLKGSGWYVTDYPSEARKKGMEGEKKVTKSKEDKGKKASGAESTGNSKKLSTTQPSEGKAVSTS